MQLTVDIKYEQLIDILKNLPANQLAKIKSDLDNTPITNNIVSSKSDFQKLLLNGPVMSDVQFSAFKENRKTFNQWRRK